VNGSFAHFLAIPDVGAKLAQFLDPGTELSDPQFEDCWKADIFVFVGVQ
jgi:hypothetical protein